MKAGKTRVAAERAAVAMERSPEGGGVGVMDGGAESKQKLSGGGGRVIIKEGNHQARTCSTSRSCVRAASNLATNDKRRFA